MNDIEKIEWSDTVYSFKDLVNNFTLPQLVMVDEGYMLNETESLSSGQLITVQSHESVTQFKGTDAEGKAITIPIKCPFTVKLVAKGEGKIHKGVKDLCQCKDRPKYVEVTATKGKRDLGLLKVGDKLKILLTERGPDGPMYLHFRNQKGKHLRLPVDYQCEFRTCAEDDQEHALSDLVGKELPMYIKFVDSRTIGDWIGLIELTECVDDVLVFSSTKHEGRMFVTAFPLNLDVKVRTIKDSSVAKRFSVMGSDSSDGKIDMDKFQGFFAGAKGTQENGYVYFAPLEAIESNGKPSAVTKDDQTLPRTNTEDSENSVKTVNEYEQPVPRPSSPKRKSIGFLSKVRLKLRGSKSSKRKSEELRPEIVIIREGEASSYGKDGGVYEEIPANTYVSMDVIDGARRVLGTGSTTPVKKRSLSRVQSSALPPPLPGNHPLERRHTYSEKTKNSARLDKGVSTMIGSRERENFRRFYDNMKMSEQQILNCDIEGVGNILKAINLQKYAGIFRDNQVDGKLLIDLDEAVFKDIGLSPFEARKLRKYVFGWRPDEKQNSNYSPPATSVIDSNEALRWNETEVANHVAGLGLVSFSDFCRQNQVNGDLLWDIVVDEEIIYGLLTGKDRRLNAVKLKNYVTEGWRPKVSKKRANSVNFGTIERKSKMKDDKTKGESTSLASVKDKTSLSKSRTKPVSSGAEDQYVESSKNIYSRTSNRSNSKVTYPKNSSNGKTATISNASSIKARKNSEEEKKRPSESTKLVMDRTVQSKTIQERDRKNRPATVSHTRDAGSRTFATKTGNSATGSPNDASPRAEKKPAISKTSVIEVRPNRSFSLREKKVLKNGEKSAAPMNIKKNAGNDGKGARIQHEATPRESPKRKTDQTSKDSTKITSIGKTGSPAHNAESRSAVGKDIEPQKTRENQRKNQTPSIASLRKNYERCEQDSFKEGERLQRARKNNKGMAIKRKDSSETSNSKENEKMAFVNDFARLKEQFDTKPLR